MSPPEANVRRRFEELLLEAYPGTVLIRTHGEYIPVGFPDVIGWIPSRPWAVPLAIEYKAPGEKPRKIQWHWLKKLLSVRVIALVVDDPESDIDELHSMLREIGGGR